MNFLKTLNFSEYTQKSSNPKINRRRKLISKIDEQILLATDSSYTPTKVKWLKSSDGIEQKVEVPKRIKRWWSINIDGSVQLTVRYGSRLLEFAKGKNAIELDSEAEVAGTLAKLKEAVEAGELDALIEQQAQFGRAIKRKASA